MGCGTSSHRPPSSSPVATPVFSHVDNDDWMLYAPRHAHQGNDCCCFCFDRPTTTRYTSSRCTDYADSQRYTSTSSYWDSSDGRPHAIQSPTTYLNLSQRGSLPYSNRSYTPRSTPAHSSPCETSRRPCTPRSTPAHSSPCGTSRRPCTPRSTPAHSSPGEIHTPRPQAPKCRPSLAPASSATYTSRSYSLLSTPTFHSPSSHPKNDLTLDPTLFSNNLSPFADAACANKIDTDCASRFSGSSRSSLSAFTSPTSSCNRRYPLTPLSVHTEPFPRV